MAKVELIGEQYIDAHEAQKALMHYLGVDDLAMLLSQLPAFHDCAVIVKSDTQESCAYRNGERSDADDTIHVGDANEYDDEEED